MQFRVHPADDMGMESTPSESTRLSLGLFGAVIAAIVALPAWSGTLALDARAATPAAIGYGVIVARGWWLAARSMRRDDLMPLAAVTFAGALAGEWGVARFIASRTGTRPLATIVHAFREPPSWGGLALAAALLGVWIAVRRMAEPGEPKRSETRAPVSLARALPRASE